MSILTALFFFFSGIGAGAYTMYVKKEIKRLDDKLVEYSARMEIIRADISDMRVDIAKLVQSTQHIEHIFEKHTNTIEAIVQKIVAKEEWEKR